MKKYLKYLWYILKHKYYVTKECFRHGLYWRGIIHDLSKFLPSEFFPYAEHFYGRNKKEVRDKTGYYKPTDTGDEAFDFAWLLHQKRNDHHWQYWTTAEDTEGIKIFPMSYEAMVEMLCDWCGASYAQGHGGWKSETGVLSWYKEHNNKMQLHSVTRTKVEAFLKEKSKQ